jgi:O-antigen/teichoic acid export membrane protein
MSSTGIVPERRPEADATERFRSQMGRVSRQSSVFLAGTLFSAAAAYLFKVYLARTLGAQALGIYALGMTMVGFVAVFSSLGLPRTALRFVSAYSATGKRDQLRGFLTRSMAIVLVCNLLLGGALYFAGPWIAVRFYHAPQLKPYVGFFVAIMVLGGLGGFLGQVLGGYKDVSRRTVINNFIGSPTMMAATVILVLAGLGLRGYIVAQLIGVTLVLTLYFRLVWKLTPRPEHGVGWNAPPFEREVVGFAAAALGLAFLDFFIIQADRVMIGHYLEVRQVGIYAVSWSLVAYLSILLNSVNQIFAPTISDLHARGERELLGRMYQTLTKWIFGLTVPLATAMIIFAAPLMRIFGRDFEAGWAVLVIGALGQLVNCGVGSAGTLLLMSGNQRSLVWVQAGSAVTTVILDWLLIPHWGILGAAAASAVTMVGANLAYLNRVRHKLQISPYNRSYFGMLIPVLGSVVSLWLVKWLLSAIRPEWAGLAVGLVLAYVSLIGLALLTGLDSDDRVILRAVWSRIAAALPGMGVEE